MINIEKARKWFEDRNIKNFDCRIDMEAEGYEVRMFEKVFPGKVAVVRTVVSSENQFDRLEWLVNTFNQGRDSHWENVQDSPFWLF